jgi:poly [ADP-ribose] polymerase 10/14/15
LRLKHPNLELNEKYAFHGTSEKNVQSIVKDGFKFRFNGRHNYGRGSYFAVHASYSLDPAFAVKNAEGKRFLFINRVCLGKSVSGTPELGPSTNESYQSAVDYITSPSMYITFHDDQTYPEFLAILK